MSIKRSLGNELKHEFDIKIIMMKSFVMMHSVLVIY